MNAKNFVPWLIYAALGLFAFLFLWAWIKGPKKAAEDATRMVIDVAGGVVVGTTKGVGGLFGVPDTDRSQCDKDVAAGSFWSASFDCPASDFFRGIFGKSLPPTSISGPDKNPVPYANVNADRLIGQTQNQPSDGWHPLTWLEDVAGNAKRAVFGG